jgi:hypothetical protein
MNCYGYDRLRLVNALIQERIDVASRDRRVAAVERPSIRRSIGYSMIRIGRRLAAEPYPNAGSAAMSG